MDWVDWNISELDAGDKKYVYNIKQKIKKSYNIFKNFYCVSISKQQNIFGLFYFLVRKLDPNSAERSVE